MAFQTPVIFSSTGTSVFGGISPIFQFYSPLERILHYLAFLDCPGLSPQHASLMVFMEEGLAPLPLVLSSLKLKGSFQ